MENNKIDSLLLWGSFYAFVITGMAVLITGSIMPYLIEEFKIGYGGGGLLLGLQAVGNLGASLIGGIISDYTGRKAVMAFGALCFVVGFGGVFFISSGTLLYILLFIAGLGWGIMNSMVNSVVNDAAEGRSDILNLLHMFFAIGAFLTPILVGLMERFNVSWRYSVLTLSILSAILFVVFLMMKVPEQKKDEDSSKAVKPPFTNIRYYIFMAILFLYVGTENSINGWLATYLNNLNVMTRMTPQDMLSMFWVAIILGRLISAGISKYISREALILILCTAGTISYTLFILTKNPVLIAIWVFAMGFFLAGVYPTVVANAGSIIQGSGSAAGIMLSFGGMGGAFFPYINGLIADARGLYAGMVAIVVSAVILIVMALVNLCFSRRTDS
ncbi:MAG: MFS transporter [Caldicoprobacterales bacterium]